MLNTVGKDLSQWFDVEPHVSTAAFAGVALGRMYPSVLKEHGRQPGIQSACGWSAACKEEEGGEEEFAPGWWGVEERGVREQGWVSAWCVEALLLCALGSKNG